MLNLLEGTEKMLASSFYGSLVVNKQRIDWIDIAKGIGIFLMVVGHTSIPSFLSNYIFSFHMPLFFIILKSAIHTTNK